ncbi:mitochondrial ribosomal protein S5 [Lycorma delicatula]|uniref:mitochondrial ribosomal protein S5 n=1 Tax=Lycorma delicatula TaxID=130591 RepID=UPI003F515BED
MQFLFSSKMLSLRNFISKRLVSQILFSENAPVRNLVRQFTQQKPLIQEVKIPTFIFQQTRNTSFFNKSPAESIWKGVTSVSNAGRKRGRGRGNRRKIAKNLNRGQVIGVGRANIIWPGLTTAVLRGKELVERQKLPEDPDRDAKLIKLRNEMGKFRPLKLSPIERGWSGTKMPGRSIGPPDPVGTDTFEGFDTRVLEMKTVTKMTGNLGKVRRQSAFAVTGNGQGLAGFALAKAIDPRAALKAAKNRSGQKLMYINRYNDHTVMHDFVTQFGRTKIYVAKKPEGYGLTCHRAIRTICQILGIKDLYAKVEGPMNVQNITKAFFIGLLRQKTHEQLAEETNLHLVELREENDYFPEVVASPTNCLTDCKEPPNFNQYCLENRVRLQKKKWPPFYTKLPSYENYLLKTERRRSHAKTGLQLRIQYGQLQSFLYEKYPECKAPGKWQKDKKDDSSE